MDPTTTAKRFQLVSTLEYADGGHGHWAWEFRQPLALLLGHCAHCCCPYGVHVLVGYALLQFPHLLSCGTGRHHYTDNITCPQAMSPLVCIFCKFSSSLCLHRPPALWLQQPLPPPPPLSLGRLTQLRALSLPLPTSHVMHTSLSLHIYLIPPSPSYTWWVPPEYPKCIQGDLPLGVAPCMGESSHL